MARYGRAGRSNGGENFIFIFIMVFVALMTILLIVTTSIPENTDPKKHTVYIGAGVAKICDGTTLVYNGDGTQVVPNSSECS